MDKRLRKLAARRAWQGLAVLILAAGTAWAVFTVREVRHEVYRYDQTLGRLPEKRLKILALESSLNERRHDVERLRSFVVQRDAVGEVVGLLQANAGKRGIDLRVLKIEEDEEPAAGFFPAARLQISGFGRPERLLEFLHEVEHAPYLLDWEKWRIVEEDQLPRRGESGSAPIEESSALPSTSDATAKLEATINLSISHE